MHACPALQKEHEGNEGHETWNQKNKFPFGKKSNYLNAPDGNMLDKLAFNFMKRMKNSKNSLVSNNSRENIIATKESSIRSLLDDSITSPTNNECLSS